MTDPVSDWLIDISAIDDALAELDVPIALLEAA